MHPGDMESYINYAIMRQQKPQLPKTGRILMTIPCASVATVVKERKFVKIISRLFHRIWETSSLQTLWGYLILSYTKANEHPATQIWKPESSHTMSSYFFRSYSVHIGARIPNHPRLPPKLILFLYNTPDFILSCGIFSSPIVTSLLPTFKAKFKR